ncbi:MAG: anthranilate phosphoribosyltransferase [Candidatus Nanopelagicales bacterium]
MTRQSWPEVLSALLAKQDLASDETSWAMAQIMAGEATSAQIAAFVIALRAKGETAAEVTGLVDAMLAAAQPLTVDGPTLDVVGTGGDMAQTVNISTMSALVAAAAGAKVVKHGNRAASSQCGSADVLSELGVAIELSGPGVERCVDEVGIGFAFAPVFHPAMRFAGPTRREIGVPTVFNILGPLANPARPTAAMIGCANLRLAPVMADVLAGRGTNALVVRGSDGLDEVTIFADTEVWDATRGGAVHLDSIRLAATGVSEGQASELKGGTAELNAKIARDMFGGATEGPLRAVRDAVVLNTAAALVAWDAANGIHSDEDITARVIAAMPRAAEAIDSGAVLRLLDRWAAVSSEAAR